MKKGRSKVKKEIVNSLLILAGIFSAAFGLKAFLIPNEFIDGGVTGISLLISSITNWPISILIIVINIPFIILGYRRVNKLYAIKTMTAIFILSIILYFITFPEVTHDKLLTAVFGGFFLGTGIGLAMRGGCVIDGTELLAVYINPKSFLSVGQIVLVINIIIFCVAAFFLGIQPALYSILTYLAASQMINYIIQGFDEYTAITIISPKSELIKNVVIRQLRKGVTVYKGERGYGRNVIEDKNIDILYLIVTRLEVSQVVNTVQRVDQNAFIITHSGSEVKGGLVKRHV